MYVFHNALYDSLWIFLFNSSFRSAFFLPNQNSDYSYCGIQLIYYYIPHTIVCSMVKLLSNLISLICSSRATSRQASSDATRRA